MNTMIHALEQLYVLVPLLPVAVLFFFRKRLSYLWTFWPLFGIGIIMSTLVVSIVVLYLLLLVGQCTTGSFWSANASCGIAFLTPLVRLINPLATFSVIVGVLFILIGIPFLLELLLRRRK